jgi:cytochrome c-type biogenesis protein
MPAVTTVSGVFLIAVGFLITTNSLSVLSAFLTKYGVGWTVGQ